MSDKIPTTQSGRTFYHVFDEDDMASDSAIGLCTQQSIKAYVDSEAGLITGIAMTAAEGIGLLISTSTPTIGVSITSACETAGISIAGNCVTGVVIGAQTTAGITIAATTKGIDITGACSDTGIELSGTAANFGIDISAAQTAVGLGISGTCGTYGISLAGACTTAGIGITGAEAIGILIATSTPTIGLSITSACETAGVSIAGDCVTGITIGAQTTAGITIATTGIGIEMNGTYNNCLRLTNALTTSAQTTVRVLDTYDSIAGYHTAVMGASIYAPTGVTGAGAVIGVYGEANIQSECTGTNWSFGVRGTLQLNDTTVLNGASSIFGAINASMKDNATPTLTAGHVCGIYIENLIDADLSAISGITAMIYSANNSSATCTMDYGWYNYGPAVTNLLGLYDCTVSGCVSAGGTVGTHGTSTVKIAIDIDGTTHYLLASTVPTFT